MLTRLLKLQGLSTSSVSNVRWSMHSAIFTNVSLFANLRSLQLSIREDALAADAIYAHPSSETTARAFVRCLMTATNLTSLDLEMCSMRALRCTSARGGPVALEPLRPRGWLPVPDATVLAPELAMPALLPGLA